MGVVKGKRGNGDRKGDEGKMRGREGTGEWTRAGIRDNRKVDAMTNEKREKGGEGRGERGKEEEREGWERRKREGKRERGKS